MFDTYLTITGNVLVAPTWRRTQRTQALVANFKVASTARRFDKDTGAWVDGDSLRVRVNCWRRLAEGVAASVMVGDPVVVVGRLYTRDWTDADGVNRTTYELEAVSVGHDLARGRSAFTRNRPVPGTSEVAGAAHDSRVRGEAAEAVPHPAGGAWGGRTGEDGEPGRYGGGYPPARWGEVPEDGPVPDESPDDAVRVLRGGGFDVDAELVDRGSTGAGVVAGGDVTVGLTGRGNADGAETGSGHTDDDQARDEDLISADPLDDGSLYGEPATGRTAGVTPARVKAARAKAKAAGVKAAVG